MSQQVPKTPSDWALTVSTLSFVAYVLAPTPKDVAVSCLDATPPPPRPRALISAKRTVYFIEGPTSSGQRVTFFATPMSPTPAPRMTRDWLRAHCRAHKLYVTPSLNDTLHLHYQGFARIEDLEEYTGLKSVFLEGNGLESLDGLQVRAQLAQAVAFPKAPALTGPLRCRCVSVRPGAALHIRAAELLDEDRALGDVSGAGHAECEPQQSGLPPRGAVLAVPDQPAGSAQPAAHRR